MPESLLTRRRALLILAAAGASAFVRRGATAAEVEWRGTALGADARIVIAGSDARAAHAVLAECLAEAERLEEIFSLYRSSSEIVRLNRQGFLSGAAPELRQLLRQCHRLHALTEGLFDPTIQPLWRAYAEHCRDGSGGIAACEVSRAELLGRIGMTRVDVVGDEVTMAEGTELTLNGIAQGYITDRIAELLARRGYRNVLIDLGEVRALGSRDDGRAFEIEWREVGRRLALSNAALAVSSGDALVFSAESGVAHILDPRTGLSPRYWRSVAVRHPSATVADALSTALILASPQTAQRIASRVREADVWTSTHGAEAPQT